MAIIYRKDYENKKLKSRLTGKRSVYKKFLGEINDEIKNNIGYSEYTISFIQYKDDNDSYKEGDQIDISSKNDIKDFLDNIGSKNADKIIVENVAGTLYISIKPGPSYWLKPE